MDIKLPESTVPVAVLFDDRGVSGVEAFAFRCDRASTSWYSFHFLRPINSSATRSRPVVSGNMLLVILFLLKTLLI